MSKDNDQCSCNEYPFSQAVALKYPQKKQELIQEKADSRSGAGTI